MKIGVVVLVLISILILIKSYESKVKGYVGEKLVAKKLSKLNKRKYKIINNLLLKTLKGTAQIDHIVISQYGIFVIETKNYKGIITGNEYDDNWNQILFNNKEVLRNPIKQNNGHIKALKDVIPALRYKKINSIILFTKRSNLKVNTETTVIYYNKVNKVIKRSRKKEFTKEEVDYIYKKLNELNIDCFKQRVVHVKNVKRNIKEAEKKLRKNKCPRCGGKLKKKKGKYGKFKRCKNYPECTFRINI
ncbi:NERD domain-containing protein [Clostridium saudiense]|uniref:NERD domain-containing protein n=1 Tax=Clostridium saudiense TaxID=1414720 RepID=A0ABS2FBM7_9CLOT|nr:nuclease-related domain-containing protein [Clostridium saudiense]MBM6817948.1 NERD domain-containing protein [Clostridium saudiense]